MILLVFDWFFDWDGWHEDIFQDGALRQEVMGLKNKADAPVSDRRQFQVVQAADLVTIQQDLAIAWAVQCADDVQ